MNTATELAHQLNDSGAAAIVVLKHFAYNLQEVLDQHPSLTLTVITTEVGDMFSLVKEMLTNVVVKYVKKLLPAWKIDGATEFNTALRSGHAHLFNVLITNPRDMPAFVHDLKRYRFTAIIGVNTLYRALPLGEAGEICVLGPQVMPGYWGRPDETHRVFTADGWLRTGDMALSTSVATSRSPTARKT